MPALERALGVEAVLGIHGAILVVDPARRDGPQPGVHDPGDEPRRPHGDARRHPHVARRPRPSTVSSAWPGRCSIRPTSAPSPLASAAADLYTCDVEAEAAAAGAFDAHRRLALVEAALEQDQPALEVVLEARQSRRRVEPQLPVGEVDPAVGAVLAQQRPQDAAGDALDQVVAVEERAAVDGEEPHARVDGPSRVAGAVPGPDGRRRDSSLARSSVRTCSMALAEQRRRRRRAALLVGRRRTPPARSLSTTSTPTSCAERHRRHDEPALGARRARASGPRGPGATPPRVLELRRIDREYLVICRRLPTRTGSQRAAAMPIEPVADDHLGADALGVEARGCRSCRGAGPSSSSSSRWHVAVAEQLVEPVEGGVDERVEVGAASDPRRPARRAPSRPATAAGGVRHVGPAASPDGCRRDLLDVDHPEDVGRPQPEDVLHARAARRWRRHRSAAARTPGRGVRSARRRAPAGTRRRSPGRSAAGSPAGSRPGCGPSST